MELMAAAPASSIPGILQAFVIQQVAINHLCRTKSEVPKLQLRTRQTRWLLPQDFQASEQTSDISVR